MFCRTLLRRPQNEYQYLALSFRIRQLVIIYLITNIYNSVSFLYAYQKCALCGKKGKDEISRVRIFLLLISKTEIYNNNNITVF